MAGSGLLGRTDQIGLDGAEDIGVVDVAAIAVVTDHFGELGILGAHPLGQLLAALAARPQTNHLIGVVARPVADIRQVTGAVVGGGLEGDGVGVRSQWQGVAVVGFSAKALLAW